MVGTLWVCRAAFLSGSVLAWLIIAFGAAVMIVHYFLLRARKRKLRTGVDNSTGSGVENFLVVIQLALVAVAALVLEQ
jgi:uncharacterized membrane protein